jgi:hypothetical protein
MHFTEEAWRLITKLSRTVLQIVIFGLIMSTQIIAKQLNSTKRKKINGTVCKFLECCLRIKQHVTALSRLVQSTLLARYWISSSEARRIRKGRT